MTPWTALWLAALGAAVLAQSHSAPPGRVWTGRGLAAAVGLLTVVVSLEYATARTFGVDQVWFGDAVRTLQSSWPGRPSPQTALSTLFMSAAIALMRLNGLQRLWVRTVWAVCLGAATATPFVVVVAYLFTAIALISVTPSTGMALVTALALLLLGAAALLVRPHRASFAWLLSRPHPQTLIRLVGILTGFPIFVGLSRRVFLTVGLGNEVALTLSTVTGTVIVGLAAYYLSQREQALVEANELDRALLRANAESMLDPQVLFEAVRDPSGRVVDAVYRSVNHATCSHLGLAKTVLVGSNALDTMPNLESSGLLARYAQCLADGKPVILDDFTFCDDVEDSRRYDLRATRAGLDLISVSWSDVTERFQSTQRIAVSEQNYRLLADNAIDVVCRVRDAKFVWMSPSAEAVLGAPPEYWLGRTAMAFLRP